MKPDKDKPDTGNGDGGGKNMVNPRVEHRDMGSALRSVYQQTIDEKIPDEMLDLLGKLD